MLPVSPLHRLRRVKPAPRLDHKLRRWSLTLERLEDRLVPSGIWVEQGPGPILGEFNSVIPNPNHVAGGAIASIAVDPENSKIIWAATVNGGVWKTNDANDFNPVWRPLTDTSLPFLSTNSIAISPFNSDTVFVGTGSTSSDASQGVAGFGVARTTDGGDTWTVAGPAGLRVRKVLATPIQTDTGEVVLWCTLTGNSTQNGVYRSVDDGTTYTRISGTGGLPSLGVGDLAEDPGNPNRIYAAVPGGGSAGGVYRSDDGGVNWTQVDTGLSGFGSAIRAKITTHFDPSNDDVYVMFMNSSGGLAGVFRSDNQGTSWVSMGVPVPDIFPGRQGSVHGALAADPNDPNVVYIAGDRQNGPFPNANGATSFSDNSFRGTFSPSGTTWVSLDGNGANMTSSHPDTRSMVFDANGNLLQSNDGGIYRLNNPSNPATRAWVSLNGNLRVTEFHSISFDPLSKVVFGGTQDNGTPVQAVANQITFDELQGGDGGVVGVDGDQTAHPNTSIRYTSSQFFGGFFRSTWDPNNNFLGGVRVGLNITGGAGTGKTLPQFDPNIQFYQPFVINSVAPTRMMIGTAQFYESLNQGDSLNDLGGFNGFFVGNNLYGQPMVYGGRIDQLGIVNPDVFYGGIGAQIKFKENLADPLTVLSGYHGGIVSTIAMNPRDYRNIYVVDTASQIWASFDKGVTFSNITLNLGSLSPQIDTLAVLSPSAANPTQNVLVAGGIGGVWALQNPTSAPTTTWAPLGKKMPNSIVQDLHFDTGTNTLVAGTLGRGAWTLFDPTKPASIAPQIVPPSNSNSPNIPDLDPQMLDELTRVILMGDGGRPDPGAEEMNVLLPDNVAPPLVAQQGSAVASSGATVSASPALAQQAQQYQETHARAVSTLFGHAMKSKRDDLEALFADPFASVL
jgi:hypothetical protein